MFKCPTLSTVCGKCTESELETGQSATGIAFVLRVKVNGSTGSTWIFSGFETVEFELEIRNKF